MEYAVQRAPSESGRLEGIAYDLWLPDEDAPSPAVVVLHGAGSQKENHADYARVATSHGFVALTFDNRGHGQSEGKLSPRTIADVQRLVHVLTERPEVDGRRVAARGSSMGGLLAIHAAAATTDIAAVVAICPATEELMLEDLRRVARGEPAPPGSALETMRVDAPALAAWLEEHDVRDAVRRLGSKPLMLVHARDDEVVPHTISEELYERATEPKRILVLEDGHHRSAQHDTEVQGETLRWLARVM